MGSIIGFQIRWGLQTAALALLGGAVWGWSVSARAADEPSGPFKITNLSNYSLKVQDALKNGEIATAKKLMGQEFAEVHSRLMERKDADDDKEEKEKENIAEQAVKGVMVNGQPLYEATVNGQKYKYYYVNGDTKSPFISMENPDGSFKWTTKNAMMGKTGTGPGGLTELGMIETSNGKLGVMYQTPNGGRAFSDGSKWFSSPSGQNSFTQSGVLTAGTDTKVKVPKPFRVYEPPNMTNPRFSGIGNISEIGKIFERVPREISPSQGYTETFKNPSVPSINGGGGGALLNDGGMVCSGGSCSFTTTVPASVPREECSGGTCRLRQSSR